MDEFEQFLSQQPFHAAPSSLRREVLSAPPVWQEWLWPSPVAWGALVAYWMFIAGLQWAARLPRTTVAGRDVPQADFIAALAEQRRLLAELETPNDHRPPPGPRSELIRNLEEV